MPEPGVLAPLRERLESMARDMRGSVASLRAAAETLQSFPVMGEERRRRLLGVVADEAERLGQQAQRLEELASGRHQAVMPPESVRADELVAAIDRTAQELGFAIEISASGEDTSTFLGIALEPLLVAAAAFLGELRREMAVARLLLRTQTVGEHCLLDLTWAPEPADLARLLDWQGGILDEVTAAPGGRDLPAIVYPGLRRVAREHDGEAWFNLDRDGTAAHVRVLLPLALIPVEAGA